MRRKDREDEETNYAPWLLGAAGLAGLGGLAYANRDELAKYLSRPAGANGGTADAPARDPKKLAPAIAGATGVATAGAGYLGAKALISRSKPPLPGAMALLAKANPDVKVLDMAKLGPEDSRRYANHVALADRIGSFYDPQNSAVALANKPGHNSPDVLAHEMGHHRTRGELQTTAAHARRLNMLSGLAMPLTQFSDDGRVRAAGAAASTLPQLPVLIDEIRASRAGGKMLQDIGHSRWGAYRGLPSYLGGFLAPVAGYAAGEYARN